VQSLCNPLIEDNTEIFYMIDKGDIPSIHCKMSLRPPKSMRKLGGLSLIFLDFFVAALTQSLNSTETSLQLSENITLFAVYRCLFCHQQRDLDIRKAFGAYHVYVDCGPCYMAPGRTKQKTLPPYNSSIVVIGDCPAIARMLLA
jgi:hypothetical protein